MLLSIWTLIFGMERDPNRNLIEQNDTGKLRNTYLGSYEADDWKKASEIRDAFFNKKERENIIKEARKLMEVKVDPNDNILEWYCFLISQMDEYCDVFKQLLDYGVNPIIGDSKMGSMLICIINQKCIINLWILAEKLLSEKRSLSLSKKDSISLKTPLEAAINGCSFTEEDYNIIKTLLTFEADPNGPGFNGDTPLILLIKKFYEMQNKDLWGMFCKIIASLVLHKADPRIQNKDGKDAVQIAYEIGFRDLFPSYI